MNLNTDNLSRCILTLEASLELYLATEPDTTDREVFRNAIVKGYELCQETSFKLMKRALKDFGYGGRRLETTPVKEILRLCATHGIMSVEEVERWFVYRDNRNDTAHDYGEAFAQETLKLLPGFLKDVKNIEAAPDRSSERILMPEYDRSQLTIPQRYLDMVLSILAEIVPEAEVWAYGSRVDGSWHEASDLDLTLRNPMNLETPFPRLFELRAAFIESNIPIRVDVMDWARIPESFRLEISRRYVTLRERAAPSGRAGHAGESVAPAAWNSELRLRGSVAETGHDPWI